MQKIGIIGIGKLGLCFALNLERKGYSVVGVDINTEYVDSINNKTLGTSENLVVSYLKKSTTLSATTSLAEIVNDEFDILFVFVATPSLPDGSYDHSQIERISNNLIAFGKRKKIINLVIGCTTMPGYCDELAKKMNPFNYAVSYNPEFIAQGSIIKNQQFPDQVLIGEDNKKSGDEIQKIYTNLCENEPVFCRMDRLSAEIAKIATNCFLTTKISFANSIGDLALKTGADKDSILNAIGSDSRIGKDYLDYGFGFGGPCFPRDNRALGKFAKKNDFPLYISEATDKVNKQHFQFQLNQLLIKHPINSTVRIKGVSYKKGSTLIDESQQLALAIALVENKRKVIIEDKKEVIVKVKNKYPNFFKYKIIEN